MTTQPNAIPLAKMSDVSGPAFPACNEANLNGTMGMSLRDWFAGQAMRQGMAVLLAHRDNLNDFQFRRLADTAYCAADAMLAARATTP